MNVASGAGLNALDGPYTTSNPTATINGYNFKNKQFGAIPGLNRMYFDGRTCTYGGLDYTVDPKNGLYYNPITRRSTTYGLTVYNHDGTSDVYMAPGALNSAEDLFVTMGHEFVHVINNFWMSGAESSYTENAAYNYTLEVAKANGYDACKATAIQQLSNYPWEGDFRYFRYNLPLRMK